MNTCLSLLIKTLIRSGTQVLTKNECWHLICVRLLHYWWFLFKARLMPSRCKDKAFQAFHNTKILYMLVEPPDENRETRFILKFMRTLLSDRSSTFSIP